MYDLTVEGWMGEEELKQIEIWAASVPPSGVIVEVGTYKGRSAIVWASSCDPSVTLYCYDYFENEHGDIHQEFLENTKHLTNIKSFKGSSPKQVSYTGAPIDIFFLDASHQGVQLTRLINYHLPLMKSGGIFCGHDYTNAWPGVIATVKFLEELLGKEVTLYPNTTLWSFRIP
jgi:predicted O-methyltransferase YrrM